LRRLICGRITARRAAFAAGGSPQEVEFLQGRLDGLMRPAKLVGRHGRGLPHVT
jgi:hypothetical protein